MISALHLPPEPIPFQLPASQPHSGIPLANGTLGVLLWTGSDPGQRDTLSLTLGRQDYWLRVPPIQWHPDATFGAVCDYLRNLEAGNDSPDAPARWLSRSQGDGMPDATILPVGRFEITSKAWQPLSSAYLAPGTGQAIFDEDRFRAIVLPDRPLCLIRFPAGAAPSHYVIRPLAAAGSDVGDIKEFWDKYGIVPPETLPDAGGLMGWVQEHQGQPSLCAAAAWQHDDSGGLTLAMTVVYGDTPQEARQAAAQELQSAPGWETAAETVAEFWGSWWERVARVALPDIRLQRLYDLGLWRLGGCTRPHIALPPTLQGPWVEDTRMPPWSCDYHFNVNVQLVHSPILRAGVPEYLEPLTRKLGEWMPQMREYARLYVGIEDGLLLPTAVNDRCEIVGTGWNNHFDPGSGAWMALMLWDHYRYTGDMDLLRTVTYPMLRGHLRVYEAMLRQHPDSTALFLPSGPSPEYHRPGRPGWGEDASYQLAFIHALARAASEAATVLEMNEPRLSEWAALSEMLPTGCFQEGRIFLWRGQDLDESHRHPAHLAGIWPCELYETSSEDSGPDTYPAATVRNSLHHWVRRGQGEWAGWSTVAAAQIWAHYGDSDAALGMLETYREWFAGPNYAPRHNAQKEGYTFWTWGAEWQEIMQLDAGIGFVAVVLEILARPEAIPQAWRDVAFTGLKMPGGSTLSGMRERGEWVRLESSPA